MLNPATSSAAAHPRPIETIISWSCSGKAEGFQLWQQRRSTRIHVKARAERSLMAGAACSWVPTPGRIARKSAAETWYVRPSGYRERS
jgi:hypothetical protein